MRPTTPPSSVTPPPLPIPLTCLDLMYVCYKRCYTLWTHHAKWQFCLQRWSSRVFFFFLFKSVAILAAFDSLFPKKKKKKINLKSHPFSKPPPLTFQQKTEQLAFINDIILNHDFSFFFFSCNNPNLQKKYTVTSCSLSPGLKLSGKAIAERIS